MPHISLEYPASLDLMLTLSCTVDLYVFRAVPPLAVLVQFSGISCLLYDIAGCKMLVDWRILIPTDLAAKHSEHTVVHDEVIHSLAQFEGISSP